MTAFFLTIGAGNCLITACQDFRYREIHLLPLIFFALSGVFYRYSESGWAFLGEWLTNLTLLASMLSLVWLFYRIKGTKKVMDVKMGWGDVIFLAILGIWLKPFSFLFFYSANTFLLSIVFVLGRMTGMIPETYPIPLAGVLGIAFSVFMPLWHFFLPENYFYP
ncbi:MAG: prepilin peptidase [Bacteroidia bacterium]|nr:prepilin peptidase [Bacteroidia bacterium]